jgi:hypothetical protein
MADRPLREPERLHEVADARFAVRLGLDQAQETEPRRLGENLQNPRELVRLILVKGAFEEGRAAGGDRGDGLHVVKAY